MDGMDAWGGREGVFVIERSRRDREGTIWVGDRGSACVIERCPREIEIDHAHVCDGD